MKELKEHFKNYKSQDPILISNNILKIERRVLSLRFELAYFEGKSVTTAKNIERYEDRVKELRSHILDLEKNIR